MEKQANIIKQEFHGNFTFDNNQMLQLDMENFLVQLQNKQTEKNINAMLGKEQNKFFQNAVNVLYPQAVREYKNRKDDGNPFNGFGAAQKFEVAYNQNCYLSTYYDNYEFTGGAHGLTNRNSLTFQLNNGYLVPLTYFTAGGTKVITNEILRQARENMQKDSGIYFEDYEQNIVNNFNPKNFYLTPDGIVIYYQQYEIAPYAAGIIEFTIPYSLIPNPPRCLKL